MFGVGVGGSCSIGDLPQASSPRRTAALLTGTSHSEA